jgi:hypothetical protein
LDQEHQLPLEHQQLECGDTRPVEGDHEQLEGWDVRPVSPLSQGGDMRLVTVSPLASCMQGQRGRGATWLQILEHSTRILERSTSSSSSSSSAGDQPRTGKLPSARKSSALRVEIKPKP